MGTAVTAAVDVPTIGIGAGPDCDGQVLVFHDVLGLGTGRRPKFVRQYANLAEDATKALAAFAADVRSGAFPTVARATSPPTNCARRSTTTPSARADRRPGGPASVH